MQAASVAAGRPGQILAVLLGTVALARRDRTCGLALAPVMAGAGLLQLAAKWCCDRPRPNLDAWGFPSAHVLTAVVLTGYLACALDVRAGRAARRRNVLVGGAIVATVAASRMYLDVHWLSDVVGGFCLGVTYLLAVACLLAGRPRRRAPVPAA